MDSNAFTDSRSSGSYSDEDCLPEQGLLEKDQRAQRRRGCLNPFRYVHRHFVSVQLFLFAISSGIFFALGYLYQGRHQGPVLIYSPAQEAVKYERVRFNATLVIDSPYIGPPSPEIDSAWHDLLDNMNIAVSKSDLDRLNTTSIPIPGAQDTYIAGLSVFHELHCLKRLRQYMWQDYYFPDISDDDKRLNRLHTDHCIDVLRQAIMCRADISLFTLSWSRDRLQPSADFSHEHQCVDFDAIFQWAGKRRIAAETPGLLVHPLHGMFRSFLVTLVLFLFWQDLRRLISETRHCVS